MINRPLAKRDKQELLLRHLKDEDEGQGGLLALEKNDVEFCAERGKWNEKKSEEKK